MKSSKNKCKITILKSTPHLNELKERSKQSEAEVTSRNQNVSKV